MTIDDIENFSDEVIKVIKDWFKTSGFKDRKLTDVPTEDNQIIPRKFVTANGSTVERPINPVTGQQFFDTTLNQEIFWNGSAWVTWSVASPIPANPLMPFFGGLNEVINSFVYSFAFNTDWSLLVLPAGSGAGVATIMTNFGLDTQAPFIEVNQASITPTSTIIHSCYFSPSNNFLMANEAATPTIYKYDGNSTLSTETALTISGTTIANCLGLAADSTYIYVLVTTTTVKRFTLSGSTLTFVNTITLGTATERYLAVDNTYFYSMDTANTKYYLYDKTAGTTLQTRTALNLTATNFRNLNFDPDGKLRQLMSSRVIGSANTLQWYLSRLSLI